MVLFSLHEQGLSQWEDITNVTSGSKGFICQKKHHSTRITYVSSSVSRDPTRDIFYHWIRLCSFIDWNSRSHHICDVFSHWLPPCSVTKKIQTMASLSKTRRSENDNTPQPLDQRTNSPFIGQQVGNCKSFILTHYLADLFAMHHGPRSIPLCIKHHIQLTSLSFQVSRPSYS